MRGSRSTPWSNYHDACMMGGGMMWGVGLLWLLGVVVRLDNLPRATTQRNHPQRRVGVSGDDRPVACRSISPSPQTDQACAQQTLQIGRAACRERVCTYV